MTAGAERSPRTRPARSCIGEIDDETWARIPEAHRPDGRIVTRSWVEAVEMPFFGDVTNRAAVIFDGAAPDPRPERFEKESDE